MKKWLFAAIALALNSFPASAQNAPTLNNFQPGPRLIDGSQLNLMVGVVNSLSGHGGGTTTKGYFSNQTTGTGFSTGPTAATGTVIQGVGANAAVARAELDAYGNSAIFSAIRRDGTKVSPTAILTGETLGSFNYHGASTTALIYGPAARMAAISTEGWSSSAGGTKLVFSVTPNTTQTLTTALTIDQDQSVTAAGALTVSGASALAATAVSGQLRTTFGTPTISSGACGATTNGVITSGTNQAGLVTIGAASTTTCTISFSATLANAPGACVVFPHDAGGAATGTTVARVSSVSTTNFVITGSALASTSYYYLCI